jgi:diguanylate cyclase (GGDEF)-like protein
VPTALGGVVGALRLFDMRRRVSFDQIFALSFLGVGMVATLTWLAGGGATPYGFLLGLITAGSALNPPRRALVCATVCALAAFAPLTYGPHGSAAIAIVVGATLVWVTIGVLLTIAADGLRDHQLALIRDEREASELARVDQLTGLGNRRAFDEALAYEIARVRRTPMPLSVALIDLDGLKGINDVYGHLEGDAALRKVAVGVALAVRGIDAVFRWAGDEFAVIFPNTTAGEAAVVSERARRAVAGAAHTSNGEPLLVSYGVAQLEDGDPRKLIESADAALLAYKAARPPLPN